jgi:hypothetical protein
MIAVPRNFDELLYLEAHPDVADAVTAGLIASGAKHYIQYGYLERRPIREGLRPEPLRLPFESNVKPSRRDKALANIELSAVEGIEIGALASPLVSRDEGAPIYVDFTDTESLREKYKEDKNVPLENLVVVDAIWGENTLAEAIGIGKVVQYVVASHVVEHTPDLVTWLSEIREVIQPGGTLRLIVPDRRYTFDYLRSETAIVDVLDAYLRRARTPLPRQIMDFHNLASHVNCEDAWNGNIDSSALKKASSIELGVALARETLTSGTYFDTHCWVFTPKSLATLFRDLSQLDLLGFACETFFDTEKNELEFFLHMTPSDDKEHITSSWQNMINSIDRG